MINVQPYTRQEAKQWHTVSRTDDLRFDCKPLAAGVAGCCWRVAVAAMLSRHSSPPKASAALKALLGRWATPVGLAKAPVPTVAKVLADNGLTLPHSRARGLVRLSNGWCTDDWRTVLDLPTMSASFYEAIMAYGSRQAREALVANGVLPVNESGIA